MHLASANFYLLSITGPKMPADLNENMEKTVTSKAEVIAWLKRSLDGVKTAHAAATPKDLGRQVKIAGRDATVDGMYLRHHRSCERAHGTTDRVRPDDRRRASLVQGIVRNNAFYIAPIRD